MRRENPNETLPKQLSPRGLGLDDKPSFRSREESRIVVLIKKRPPQPRVVFFVIHIKSCNFTGGG